MFGVLGRFATLRLGRSVSRPSYKRLVQDKYTWTPCLARRWLLIDLQEVGGELLQEAELLQALGG